MLTDALLAFVPLGSPLSLVAAAGVDVPSSRIIDILGAGVGVAPPSIIGTASLFGSDTGIGSDRLLVDTVVGTAFTTGTSATLNVAFQGAADTGAAGGYLPDTWYTFVETGELAASLLTANRRIARFDWPPAFPETLRPRFLRLLFQVPAATLFTAGTIAYSLVTQARDDAQMVNASGNYVVA